CAEDQNPLALHPAQIMAVLTPETSRPITCLKLQALTAAVDIITPFTPIDFR
ncbi:MAG: hypothetical protein RLZZ507_3228, partial [Cyanobacteriota bacterium]